MGRRLQVRELQWQVGLYTEDQNMYVAKLFGNMVFRVLEMDDYRTQEGGMVRVGVKFVLSLDNPENGALTMFRPNQKSFKELETAQMYAKNAWHQWLIDEGVVEEVPEGVE